MKRLLALSVILIVALFGCSSGSDGDAFPTKDLEIVAPASPGGGWDTTARAIQKSLSDEDLIDKTLQVNNKPGGNGEVGWQYLKDKDAHHLAMSSSLIVTNNLLGQSDLTYEDFTPLSIMTTEWVAFAVPEDSPFESGVEIMEQLKEDPTSLNIGTSPGLGSNHHLAFVQAAKEFGVDIPQLNFTIFESGGDEVTSLLGGHIDVATHTVSTFRELHEAGDLRIVAIASEDKVEGLEDVNTWLDEGVDVVFPHWRGLIGPADMSEEEIAYWDEKLSKLAESDSWKQILENNEWESYYKDSEETSEFLKEQVTKYEELINDSGLAN